jgi:hypothetical protein
MSEAVRSEKIRLFERLAYELGIDLSSLPAWSETRRVEAEMKRSRNDRIRSAYWSGKKLKEVATEFGISLQRVHEIVKAPERPVHTSTTDVMPDVEMKRQECQCGLTQRGRCPVCMAVAYRR